ncbi:MAG TPA: phosphate ABC transporter permease PstA, partial [Actinomycetota bacterium]|nr:phosphate ABC transporter permease PstA [Actinomycetota bacterium]
MALAAPHATRSTVELALRGSRRDVAGRVFAAGLLSMLLLSLLLLVMLLASVVSDAWPVLSTRGLGFLTSDLSQFESRTGVWQGLIGSLILIAFVAVLAVPLGIAAAVYLQEYARDTRLTRVLTANIRNLAGVPSIVYGILGVVVFVQALRSVTGPDSFGRSYVSGGLTLSVLVMPFIIIITMEALRAVPHGIREAAYGVGATRWQVVRSHVLPYAAPGVFTGAILALARAFGETAPLLLVGAVTGYFSTGSASLLETLQGPYTSLPTLIFSWSRQPGEEWPGLTAAAIVVLLAVILVVNLTAIILR